MSSRPCRHLIEEWLSKKADGRLSPDEAVALELQLSACETCRERAGLFAWAANAVQRCRTVPRGFADKVLRRVAEKGASPELRARPSGIPLRFLPAAALALALVALVVTIGRTLRPPPLPPPVQVELRLEGPRARTVAVAGDFNGWDAVTMKKGEDGIWRIRLSVPPGRYQYAFLIDQEKWVPDPQAATMVESGYGGADSVLDLSL